MSKTKIKCPKCEYQAHEIGFDASVKQKIVGDINVIEVGYQCPECKTEITEKGTRVGPTYD